MATDINVVSLTGRLTRDSELRQTNTGSSVLNFSIANNKGKRKDGENWVEQDPNYFNIILWGPRGEALQQYLTKGKQVAVNGRLQQRSYQTQDGTKRSVVEIVADNVLLCSGQTSGGYNNYQNPAMSENQNIPSQNANPSSNFEAEPDKGVDDPFSSNAQTSSDPDEDIPF